MTIDRPGGAGASGIRRRDVLLGAIALVGGSASLFGRGVEDTGLPELHRGGSKFFAEDQMQLLGRIVDIIIPETDTPGALGAGVDTFFDTLMAEWASEATRSRHVALLEAIDGKAAALHGTRFLDCDAQQQQRLIADLDADSFRDKAELPEFREFRNLILAGYYTSEVGASVELGFELVPGRYLPCVPLEQIGRAWDYG
jgi:glucoside 3-dehydrogenase (cytochrome c) hitch-hiker subunit